MRLADLVDCSAQVAAHSGRLDKMARVGDLLRGLPFAEARLAVAYLCGVPLQARTGLGPAQVRAARAVPAAAEPVLSLRDVDGALDAIAGVAGSGSTAERRALLAALFARATGAEQSFLARLLLGELRQGALEGVVLEAVARVAGLVGERLRRAVMLTGDLPSVAASVLVEGEAALSRFGLRLMNPIRPMLAQPVEDAEAAVALLGEAAVEIKMDGARVQVHKLGDEVRVFTRHLNEVTAAVPEIVAAARALPARQLVLDGEALVLGDGGRPQPFQVTMKRFGRRLDVDRLRAQLPLTPFFFDCLHVDGDDLIDEPAERRAGLLQELLPAALAMPRHRVGGARAVEEFLAAALAAGHEGIMVKSLDARYEAGGRGSAWLKLKRAHTLDLVVLAAEWGSGRRQGWLSNLHLGARDPENGSFVMLGKTFKGLSDETLRWQTGELLAREIGREGHVVHVRPELVVEVAFNDVQTSAHYPGGVALRFARVKRYRVDKSAAEADTIASVRALQLPGAGRG